MKNLMTKEDAKVIIKEGQQTCRLVSEINQQGEVQTIKNLEKFKRGIDKLDALYFDFEKDILKLKASPEIVDGHLFLARVSLALGLIIDIAHFGNIEELKDFHFDDALINDFIDHWHMVRR